MKQRHHQISTDEYSDFPEKKNYLFDILQAEEIEENVGTYVHLVGSQNWYRDYDIAIQAFNEWNNGRVYGPRSPLVTIKSAMGSKS